MSRVLLPFPLQRQFAQAMAPVLDARVAQLDWRRFPDGESLVTLEPDLVGANLAIVASLHHPDAMALALRFAAQTARNQGARSVGLIAPYLAYMRQDRSFHPGEAVSATLFAAFLQQSFDWLVTVDPHLHRNPSLDRIFHIPARRVAAAPAIAEWIREQVPSPLLIGPDSESEQWVTEIAQGAGAPSQVLSKQRHGDRDVSVSLPDLDGAAGRNPVIVDDIMSSGRTVIETIVHLQALGLAKPVCIATHAVFADDAYEQILAAGAARVVSTDSIPHPSNVISVTGLVAAEARKLMANR
nr:ribose-phosphate diphosphokinase [Nitrosomonas nitrosa]